MIRLALALALVFALTAWLPPAAAQYSLVPTTPRIENVSDGSYRREMDQLEVTLPWTVTFSLVAGGRPVATPLGVEMRITVDGQPVAGCNWGPSPRTCTIASVTATAPDGRFYGNHLAWPEIRGATFTPRIEGLLFGTGPVVGVDTAQTLWVMPTLHDQIQAGLSSTTKPQRMIWPGTLPEWPLVRQPPRRVAAPWDPLLDTKGLLTWVENMGPTGRAALQRQPHITSNGRVTSATEQTYHHYHRRSPAVRLVDGPNGQHGHLWWIWQDPDDSVLPAEGHGALPSYLVSTVYALSMNGALAAIHPQGRRRTTMVGWRNPTVTEFPPPGLATPLSQRMRELPVARGQTRPGNPELVGDFSALPIPRTLGQTTAAAPVGRKAPTAGHIDRWTMIDYTNRRALAVDHAPAHAPGGQATVTLLAQFPVTYRPYGIASHDQDRDGPWADWQIITSLHTAALQALNVKTGELRVIAESAAPWTYGSRVGWPMDESNNSWEANSSFPIADIDAAIVGGGPGTWSWAFAGPSQFFEGRLYVMGFYSGTLFSFGMALQDGAPVATDMRREIGPLWKQGSGNLREKAFGIGRVGGRVTLAATTWGPGIGQVYARNDAGAWQWAGTLGQGDPNVQSGDKYLTRGVRRNHIEADYQFAAGVGANQIIWGSTGTGPFVVSKKLATDPTLDSARYFAGRWIWDQHFGLSHGEYVGRGEAPSDAAIAGLGLTAAAESNVRYFIAWNLTDASSGAAPPPPPPTLYPLTLSAIGAGTVGGPSSATASATVALVATPAVGWTLSGWSPSPCAPSFAMPAASLACTATFDPAGIVLTIPSGVPLAVNGELVTPIPSPAAQVEIELGPTTRYRLRSGVLVPE